MSSGTITVEPRDTSTAQRELARQRRAADLLRVAAVAIGRETDPLAVARETVTHAAQMTQAEWVMVGVVEDEEFRPQAAVADGRLIEPILITEDDTQLIAAVRRTQRVVVSPTELGIPVTDHHGRVVAILMARANADRRGFTSHDGRQLETLGHIAAVGLDRGRLFERLIDWNRSMEMLLAFNSAINQHLPPPELVRRLVEQAASLLHAVAGFAGLVVADAVGEMRMEADGYWAGGTWHDRRGRWARGEGTPGFVLETEFPYFSNDYPNDPLADRTLIGVCRVMCVPIKNDRSQVLGFFELHRGAESPFFSWHDAAVLESLANTAAVAVENARLWRSLEESNRQLQTMSAANADRLEEERRHISRELHDETGQVLIGIKLGLHALAGLVPADLPDVRAELDVLRQQVNEATVRIKNLAHHLRPPTLDHGGLPMALRQLADDFHRRTGVSTEVEASEVGRRFGNQAETALYRVAQEALTNTAKHAAARMVRLALADLGSAVRFTVIDDGQGFSPADASPGLGLLGMRERVAMLGGEFRLSSGSDGTTIDVTVPVHDGEQG